MAAESYANAVVERTLTFRQPALADFSVKCIDVIGDDHGPRLAVMAGMHINEVSSIAAVMELRETFQHRQLRGVVSLIPVLNRAAWKTRDILTCPVDGQNINACFPGDASGSFSSALASGILNEWASDAACLVDLHGADLCESVVRYSVCQLVGDSAFDQQAMALARCFDVDVILALRPTYMAGPGRSITGRALRDQHGAFAEAGAGGLVGSSDVAFHHDGVLRLAASLEMIDDAPTAPRRRAAPIVLSDYTVFEAPATGWCVNTIEVGKRVREGDVLSIIKTEDGNDVKVTARTSGLILWRDTNPIVSEGQIVGGLGYGVGA